jgi:hypothetical protein
MRRTSNTLVVVLAAAAVVRIAGAAADAVKVTANEAQKRVDVTVNGQPFTSYIWPDTIKKPVLYPIRSASGLLVTRGYPLDPKPGERVDHPHQVGLWFNYGNVNGLDFWNNSDAIKPEAASKYGTIHHKKVVSTRSGAGRGELAVEMTWDTPDGKTLLVEQTRFVFESQPGLRTIDRITTLTAQGQKVSFTDNKEGVIGLRVARGLEQPENRAQVLSDAQGKPEKVATPDNSQVTGSYTSSEGQTGDKVWGTRGRWTMLTGKVDGKPVTLAILDNPSNPGFPTYWHARGYGLFAANTLGQKEMSNGKETLDLALEPGKSATFRYRILVLDGTATTDQIEAQYKRFTSGS